MKKIPVLMTVFFLLLSLSGCATVMTGIPSMMYSGAPVILAYQDGEIIRDQSKVATLVVPAERYGMVIDGILVKELEGGFNPNLRLSKSPAAAVYIVDVLPGTHNLKVTYDAAAAPEGSAPATPTLSPVYTGGTTTVSAGISAPSLISWIRTSETTHTLKGGEIYTIGLALFTISGNIDLYPLDQSDHHIVIETRNQAQFDAPYLESDS